uniref:Potassium channel tetramerisation-type BTB domain-containing protein n=1 Tax=Pyrodinium bahamense TaxID=73915 RepID=A0A7S0FEM4_9DINO
MASAARVPEQVAGLISLAIDTTVLPLLRRPLQEALQTIVSATVEQIEASLCEDFAKQQAELDSMKAKLKAQQADLEAQEHAAKRAEEEARAALEELEEEKRRMAADSSAGDVLKLNIGGEKTVSVQRGTLCAVEGSMLASCFSGRWDSSLPRDQEGAYHLDFDPDIVMPLLTFLRAKRIEDPSKPAVMVPPKDRCEEFARMLRYYGMQEFTHTVAEFRFGAHDECTASKATVWLSENGRTARRSSFPFWLGAYGDVVVTPGNLPQPLTFKFRIESFGQDPGGGCGPCMGFAISSQHARTEGAQDAVLDTRGKWVYCARDGALLGDSPADVARERAPSANEGDEVALTIRPDATVTLTINGAAVGVAFRNLGGSVRPIVLMNRWKSEVRIMR